MSDAYNGTGYLKRSGYFSPYNMYMHLERCLKLPFLHIEAWAGFVFGVVTNDDTVHKKVNQFLQSWIKSDQHSITSANMVLQQ